MKVQALHPHFLHRHNVPQCSFYDLLFACKKYILVSQRISFAFFFLGKQILVSALRVQIYLHFLASFLLLPVDGLDALQKQVLLSRLGLMGLFVVVIFGFGEVLSPQNQLLIAEDVIQDLFHAIGFFDE